MAAAAVHNTLAPTTADDTTAGAPNSRRSGLGFLLPLLSALVGLVQPFCCITGPGDEQALLLPLQLPAPAPPLAAKPPAAGLVPSMPAVAAAQVTLLAALEGDEGLLPLWVGVRLPVNQACKPLNGPGVIARRCC